MEGKTITDSGSRQEKEMEEVSIDSPPELIERRVKELFPVMMQQSKLHGVLRGLDIGMSGMGDPKEGVNWYRRAPGDMAPEVQELVRQSQFLRTAGLSDSEIMMTPFWKEGLEEARAKLSERSAKINARMEQYARHTDIAIGRQLEWLRDMKIGLDMIRGVCASEADYRAIVESIVKSHEKKPAA